MTGSFTRILIIFSFFLQSVWAWGQLREDFSDGDFTAYPVWAGTNAHFTVNTSQQLQLNAPAEGTSYLSTHVQTGDEMEWRIWVRLNFAPSDNNYARIYLVSDQPDLTQPLNGYYLQLGENLAFDAITLFRQSGTVNTAVARGTEGFVSAAFAVSIKVTHAANGVWTIFADAAGGTNYTQQATGQETAWGNYSYFGLLAKYTASNTTRYYFDDIYAGPPIVDKEPPVVTGVEVVESNLLRVNFSEAVIRQSAENTGNYSLTGVQIDKAVLQSGGTSVLLTLASPLAKNRNYSLTVRQISDLAGNILVSQAIEFGVFEATPYSVLITEIMADPVPQVGLPPVEYVEIHNRNGFPLSVENWELRIGTTSRRLPAAVLMPNEYALVAASADVPVLNAFGKVIPVSGMQLANTGTTLLLNDQRGNTVHAVNYSDAWYGNNIKREGGWSLEMIDVNNPCAGQANWSASNHPQGGTPGEENSIRAANPDTISTRIERIRFNDNRSITVYFNESLDSLQLLQSRVTVDNQMGTSNRTVIYGPFYQSATYYFGSEFRQNTVYQLTFATPLRDCAGNETLLSTPVAFGLPGLPKSGDVVINEVLTNANSAGGEFIELFNRSSKIIDLRDLWIAFRDAGGQVTNTRLISDGWLLMPGSYALLTKNPQAVTADYPLTNRNALVNMAAFPVLSSTMVNLLLVSTSGEVIDEVLLTSDTHYPLLRVTIGVSVERVHPDRPSSDKTNWQSAAQSAGFATPGYQNSQYLQTPESTDELTVEPEVFSPDNDGYNDLLNIRMAISEPGYTVNIRIFDSHGRLVRHLVKNETTGTVNVYTWDGITADRQRAPKGIYVVHAEYFNLDGKRNTLKKAVVVAERFM